MKRLTLCLLLSVASGIHAPGLAQGKVNPDSLRQILATAPSDSLKIVTYTNLAWHYINGAVDMDSARMYVDSLYLITTKLGRKKGIMKAIYSYGVINHNEGNHILALEQFNEYVSFYKNLGDSLEVARGLYVIGTTYNTLGDFEKNLKIQFRILKIYQNAGDALHTANSLYSIANIHRKTGNYQEALQMYEQSTAIYDSLNLTKRYAMGIFAIANIHYSNEEYDLAIERYNQALAIARENNFIPEIAFILGNLGATYEELGENEKALSYQLEVLKIRRKLPQRHNLAFTLDNVAYVYSKLKKFDEAARHYEEAFEIARELGLKSLLVDLYKDMSEMYLAKNDYEQAYQYITLHHQAKDSIFNLEKANLISELQTKYETAEKDKQIELLASENRFHESEAQRQVIIRRALIGGVLLLAVISGFIFYTMRQRLRNQKLLARKNQEIKTAKWRERLKNLEMKALKAQMNPHFLFNSLNSINTLIMSEQNEYASIYLTKFSRLVRMMLENSDQSKVNLKDELTMLTTYIQLESMRFNNTIDFKIHLDESIDPENTYLPSMVLQPFVENAIWHGLMHHENKRLLNINITEKDDFLHCSITDNGIGREASMKFNKQSGFSKKSMGIKITAERLRLLTKQSARELIDIIDLKDTENVSLGTQVNVLIPIS